MTAAEARALFSPFAEASALVLAVSGGPDSTALLWMAARWRKRRKRGPELIAVTVDHGLRRDSAAEARDVKRLSATLGIRHITKRWRGVKPQHGLPAAARDARYRLLNDAARAAGATHILTAHTRDDQAETVLMRLARGSGLTGLAGMAAETMLGELTLARPFLRVPKARLVATLDRAKLAYVTDPTNVDPAYLRPRLRALLPDLAVEGLDAAGLSRFAARMARADEALDAMTDAAAAALITAPAAGVTRMEAAAFATLPDEIALRLIGRAVAAAGGAGAPRLGQLEALLASMRLASISGQRWKQTLAGAVIEVDGLAITMKRAPPRRRGTT